MPKRYLTIDRVAAPVSYTHLPHRCAAARRRDNGLCRQGFAPALCGGIHFVLSPSGFQPVTAFSVGELVAQEIVRIIDLRSSYTKHIPLSSLFMGGNTDKKYKKILLFPAWSFRLQIVKNLDKALFSALQYKISAFMRCACCLLYFPPGAARAGF